MLYPRFIHSKMLQALQESPALLLNGARQTGKSTLAKILTESDEWSAEYITLDDLTIRNAALSDPHGFINNLSRPVVIDEIQLAPELMPAIKLNIDRDRKPGQFLLTGSANVLTLPKVSESLAGRIELFTLFTLSQGELKQKKNDFIDSIVTGTLQNMETTPERSIWENIANGGYPEIRQRKQYKRKQVWFRDYLTTILQRDIRELAHINGLAGMPRLLELLASRVGTLYNSADVSRVLQIPQTSLKRYTSLFEATWLTYRLPPWSSNLGKRLVKAPKLYFYDTGLAAHLTGQSPDMLQKRSIFSGPLLENFVLAELHKQAGWSQHFQRFYHLRTQTGIEVDFIVELQNGDCIALEIKSAATVRPNDFKGCQWLNTHLGDKLIAGIVLYLGENIVPFGDKLWAVPISVL